MYRTRPKYFCETSTDGHYFTILKPCETKYNANRGSNHGSDSNYKVRSRVFFWLEGPFQAASNSADQGVNHSKLWNSSEDTNQYEEHNDLKF